MHWGQIIVAALWLLGDPILTQADPAVSLPRPSSSTEQQLRDETLYLKEETVSIASQHEQPISQAPSNVYVITDEEIRRSGATDVPTLLRRVPGLEVMQMTGADFNVSVRGDNQPFARRLLVMVDGRSIYIDALGFVFWKVLPVTLPEIKRIEVLKGPVSAVYGFNAVDGVINIITKTPEEMKGTTLQFGGGEIGTISSAAVHAGVRNNFGYRLSYGHDEAGQWSNGNQLAYRSNIVNAQADYALALQTHLQFSGGFAEANPFQGPLDILNPNRTMPRLAYARLLAEHRDFKVSAFWNSTNDNPTYPGGPPPTKILQFTDPSGQNNTYVHSNAYNLDLQHSWRFWPTHRLNYGVNYRVIQTSSGVAAQSTTENRLGLFAQEEWQPVAWFSAVAGVRYDMDTFINPTVSPRIALIYAPLEGHTVRAGYSVAYRSPTIFEEQLVGQLQINLPPPNPSPSLVTVTPSQNLKPERFETYELEYQGWFYAHRIRLRSSLYYNRLTDVIAFVSSNGLAMRINSPGKADFYGGDVGVEWLVSRWLTIFANYSYQQISQTLTDVAQRATPHSKVNGGLRGNWDNGMNAEVTTFYVSSTRYPLGDGFQAVVPFFPPGTPVTSGQVRSYTLLNLHLGYRFWQEAAPAGYRREAEIAVSVFNALHDTHQEHPIGDLLGTRVMGWLTVKL